MEDQMELQELRIQIQLNKGDMNLIHSLSPGVLKQMSFRGILELLVKGVVPIKSLEIRPVYPEGEESELGT